MRNDCCRLCRGLKVDSNFYCCRCDPLSVDEVGLKVDSNSMMTVISSRHRCSMRNERRISDSEGTAPTNRAALIWRGRFVV